MNKLAIVLLNWNGRELLEKFLPSIVRYSAIPGCSIVVADNGSTDSSPAFIRECYPNIQIVSMPQNYGFAGGYNHALEQIEAQYYLLINTDVEVSEGWLNPLINQLDSNPDVAVCMPKILSYNNKQQFEYAGAAGGFIDKYGYPFCRGRILNTVENDCGQYNSTADIFWATGACMLIRSSVYKHVGGFDDAFFAHMEEIDLCWRIKRLGYRITCVPQSTVYHLGGGTLSYKNARKLYLNHRNSLFTLYKNLPEKKLKRTIRYKLLLDGVSGVIYLFTFRLAGFKALLKAHSDYRRRIPELKKQREQLRASVVADEPTGIYHSLIVWKYFCGKKKFSDLTL